MSVQIFNEKSTTLDPVSGLSVWCLAERFFFVLLISLRSGGGIGDVISPVYYAPDIYWFGRLIFNVTFYLLLIVLLIAIVSGIIIDAFGGK